MDDNDVPFYNVYRSLGTKVYRIKFFFLRLTDGDIGIMIIPMVVVWGFIDRTGIGQKELFLGLPYDPTAWIIATVATALALSIGNKLRPNDSITIVIRGWFSKKIFTARSSDPDYKPTNGKMLRLR